MSSSLQPPSPKTNHVSHNYKFNFFHFFYQCIYNFITGSKCRVDVGRTETCANDFESSSFWLVCFSHPHFFAIAIVKHRIFFFVRTWLYWLLSQVRSGDEQTMDQQIFVQYEAQSCAKEASQLREYLENFFGLQQQIFGSHEQCMNHVELKHCCNVAESDASRTAAVALTIHPYHTPPEPLTQQEWHSVIESNPNLKIAVLLRSNLVSIFFFFVDVDNCKLPY
jgi:hypothetical protein